MPELVVFHRGRTLLREKLTDSLTIGGAPDCDLQLTDAVAPHHARLEQGDDGRFLIVPQEGSVYLNGKRLVGSAPLTSGDTFDIGAYRFQALEPSQTLTAGLTTQQSGKANLIPTLEFLQPIPKTFRQVRLQIGRKKGCDLILNNPYISAKHAEIFVQQGTYYLRDLHSRNGTYLNDFRITERPLPSRGTIRLGRSSLSYQIHTAPAKTFSSYVGVVIPSVRKGEEERWLVGQSRPFQDLMAKLKKIAPTDDTVLLVGETGTGKDLLAQFLHSSHLKRKKQPLVIVNAATIPQTMADSQLFGHVKGAFTGAVGNHVGFFQQADQGTLFLDEIGELAADSQARLLRVVEDGMIRPVGAVKEVKIDVRLIFATNRDLEKERFAGRFREDLYERFDWILRMPPLRERKEDIPPLVRYFLDQHAPTPLEIPDAALAFLARQPWRGNVRALNRAVRRAIANVMARQGSTLQTEDFELTSTSSAGPQALSASEQRLAKRKSLPELLMRHRGNISRVSRELGISRLTIRRWIQADGIQNHLVSGEKPKESCNG